MIEKIFAAIMVAVCVVLLLRMMLGRRRRDRFDAVVRRAWARWSQRFGRVFARPSAHALAEREAKAAIERASRRAAGEWDGNVYRPKSFKRKKRDLH